MEFKINQRVKFINKKDYYLYGKLGVIIHMSSFGDIVVQFNNVGHPVGVEKDEIQLLSNTKKPIIIQKPTFTDT